MRTTPRLYDSIGVGYSGQRRTDPRIGSQIHRALGTATTVLNVGAGTGSYEPADRRVTAVEPSLAMIAQRPMRAGPCVRGVAEHLPFADDTFDASLCLLTIHHWTTPVMGLREVRRVTRGPVVVFTFDKNTHDSTWLIRDYLQAAQALDRDQLSTGDILSALGGGIVEPILVPWDCQDGFAHAHWRRPQRYLDARVQASISCFARLTAAERGIGLAKLRRDLESGAWAQRYSDLLALDTADCGYRLAISPGAS